MNYNETTNTGTGMNIESYEDMAVNRSNAAKKVAIGAAAVVGAGAIGAGTAYAMNGEEGEELDETLTPDAVLAGAEETAQDVTSSVQTETQHTVTQEEQVRIYKEAAKEAAQAEEDENRVSWDETESYYVNDQKVASVERGTVDGHKFMIADVNGDDSADIVAIDMNDNGVYEEDEIRTLTPEDNLRMGHQTAQESNNYYYTEADEPASGYEPVPEPYVERQEPIHNNFEDEKTGDEYEDDFADGNEDYNPNADMDYDGNERYLDETDGYDNESYNAETDFAGEEESEANVESYDMAEADTEDEPYDSMMEGEEFLG